MYLNRNEKTHALNRLKDEYKCRVCQDCSLAISSSVNVSSIRNAWKKHVIQEREI